MALMRIGTSVLLFIGSILALEVVVTGPATPPAADSDPALRVEKDPEGARRAIESLWRQALEERRASGSGRDAFDRAERLGRRLLSYWDDPSFLRATRRYRRMTPQQARACLDAQRLAGQAEASHGRDAIEKLEAARALFWAAGDVRGALRVLHLLGNARFLADEAEAAEASYRELADLAAREGDRAREAAAVNNLAMREESRGRLGAAASGYRRALALARSHGIPRVEAFALLYLGNLYHRLGLFERAAASLDRAEGIFRRTGDERLEAIVASNRGASLHRQGEIDGAREAYRLSLRLRGRLGDRAGRARTLLHLAELLYESGETEPALAALEEVLAATRPAGDASSRAFRWGALLSAGDLHLARGDLALARSRYEEAQELSRVRGSVLDRIETLQRRARLSLAAGNTDRGREELATAVALVEELRRRPENEEERVRFLSTRRSLYAELAEVHLRKGDLAPALEFLERSRARAFLDSLAGGAVLSSDELGTPRVRLTAAAEIEDVERVSAALGPSRLLLHYTKTPHWLAVLAIDEQGFRHAAVLRETGRVSSQVKDFAASMRRAASTSREIEGLAEELSRLLLGPVAHLLPEFESLVIVPDDELFGIPWAALRLERRYLVETHALAVAPSASAFVRLAERVSADRAMTPLIVADPTPGGDRSRLRGAASEARAIADLFEGARVLLGPRAAEPVVREHLGGHRLIHFATHARIDPEAPFASGLELAGSHGERLLAPADGRLTGYELLAIPVPKGALVTLAACESLGRPGALGMGVVGLSRAFFEAGAGSVLASIWPVEDRATRDLMVRFYRELVSAGTGSRAEALARAQRALARGQAGERRTHPHAWAGFVLIGNES